jgi:hypothetical protein
MHCHLLFPTFLAVVILLPATQVAGQEPEPYPATLMQWSSTAEPEGGPPSLDEPLASDRPDFTEASCTVGRGVTQLEMGYTYFRNHDGLDESQSHSYPELLLRAGILAEWLELRVGWTFSSGYEAFDVLTRSTSGSDDLYTGVKLGLTPQQGIWPEMALMPQASIPLGSNVSAGEVLPGMNWLYGWDVTDWFSAAGSTQINMAVDDDSLDKFLEFAQSWTFGYSLAESLGAYTEWFAIVPSGAETIQTEHYFNAGLTYRITNDLQLDFRVGKGVSSNAIDYFAGTGLVVRM